MRRYIIIGAGAIGGAIGGRLIQAGLPTVLVARGDHLAKLRSDGLRIRDPESTETIPVTAVGTAAELDLSPDDVLVLTTKSHQAQAALADWVDRPVRDGDRTLGTAGELLPMLTALNGVASERIALRYFRRVYGVCVWLPAVHLVPGEVIIRAFPETGMLHVGRVPASATDADDRALVSAIRTEWERARLSVPLPDDVMPWKYRKLISNVGNAFQALVADSGNRSLVDAARAEARSVLSAAKIKVTSDEDEAAVRANSFTIRPVPDTPERLGGSSWQSLARGTGSIETDYLNGEIVRIAYEHGVTAPINARIASLARTAARTGQAPGSIPADQLARELGIAIEEGS